MESPNAPAHDFAPAWLKLPAPAVAVCKKPSSTANDSSLSIVDNQQHRRSSNSYNSSNRKEFNNSTNKIANSDLQQRFTSYCNNIHDSSHYLSSRHNSFVDEEEQYNKPNGHIIGNNVNGSRFNKKYIDANQRSSYRSYYREKSLNPHHSKQNRNSDSSKSSFTSKKTISQSHNKSSDYTIDNVLGEKSATNEENCNVFNQEFPSLVVGSDETNESVCGLHDNSNSTPFHSAWSNNATKSKVLSTSKHRVQLIQRSVANFDNIESGLKTETNSIVSNSKTVITSSVYPIRNMSLIGKAKGGIKENANYSKILPVLTKSSTQTTTPPMEILVKNPKMRSNKSDFLKSIRNNEPKAKDDLSYVCNQFDDKFKNFTILSNNDYKSEENLYEDSGMKAKCQENNLICFDSEENSSINCQHEDEEEEEDLPALSSSLEAEHRFLMELGWKQAPDDDPSYAPLTEDEVKEFKDLINARNGFKRSTTATMPNNQSIHLNFSPKKMPTADAFTHGNYSEDESSSSSDDD